MHGVHMHHTRPLSCMHMHSAVAQHSDATSCVQLICVPWTRHTNLCLQAETDTITTNEGRRENGGSNTNVVE